MFVDRLVTIVELILLFTPHSFLFFYLFPLDALRSFVYVYFIFSLIQINSVLIQNKNK